MQLLDSALQARFLALLPKIESYGQFIFRYLKCPHKKADAIQEMLALAWKWFVRLARRGKDVADFMTTFSSFLARAVKSGRRLVGMEKAKDVMNPQAQQLRGFKVQSLPISTRASYDKLHAAVRGQQLHDAFEEQLRDNSQTPVPEQVAFRIDFPAWLSSLTPRERQIIRAMALNERTSDLSRKFDLSPGRISQLRREFHTDWQRYCGDLPVVQQSSARHLKQLDR